MTKYKYRVKTEQEFIEEFGIDWSCMVKYSW